MIVPALLTLSLFCLPIVAQEQASFTTATASAAVVSAPDDSELKAIRKSSEDFVAAFNRGDAKAVSELWTVDGDYIDETGQVFAGREAIEEVYAEFFRTHPGVAMRVVIDSLRLLSSTFAV